VDVQDKDSLVDVELLSPLKLAIADLIDSYSQAGKLLASDLRVMRRTGTNTSMNLRIKKFIVPRNMLYSYIHFSKSYKLPTWFSGWFSNSGGISTFFSKDELKE
jgi:hypothetical protein